MKILVFFASIGWFIISILIWLVCLSVLIVSKDKAEHLAESLFENYLVLWVRR